MPVPAYSGATYLQVIR
uniref:Uncharacterized protein n=1 Tax=Arundo donax TaxID=35708 RepID=A0A0A9EGC1_ARUDO